MSDDEEIKEEPKTFLSSVKDFFCSLGIKVKLFFGAIVGIFGFVAIFLFRKNINSRQILELELEKIKKEIEIEKLQSEININDEKLLMLEGKEAELKKQIKELNEFKPREKVTEEELDEFFDDRGF